MSSSAFELVSRVLREGLFLALVLSAPPLLASLLVGLLMGALQAATQIQDNAIAFVPKLAAVVAVVLVSGPRLGPHLAAFSRALLAMIPSVR